MGEDENDVDLEVAGQKFRAKNYRLIDLIWLPMVLSLGWICMTLYTHQVDAQATAKTVADVLEKSNANIAKVLKEAGDQHADAVKQVLVEGKKQTRILTEMACLADPAMKNRGDAREFCKRMSRDDR